MCFYMAGVTGFEPVMTISKTVALGQTRRNPNIIIQQIFKEHLIRNILYLIFTLLSSDNVVRIRHQKQKTLDFLGLGFLKFV
jgi:hypothetical protein